MNSLLAGSELSRVLTSFYRQKQLIVAVFLVGSILAAYLASVLPPVYRSSTLVLMRPPKVPASFVASTMTMTTADRIQSVIQDMLSRTRLAEISDEFSLYSSNGSGSIDDRVNKLRRMINIDLQRNNVFRLSFDSEDPEKAKQVVARLASMFIEQNLETREQQATGTKSFINVEAERLRAQLEQQEADVNRFKASHRFELPDQLDANLRTLEQLRSELQASLSRLVSLQDRKATLEKQLVEAGSLLPDMEKIKPLTNQLSPAEVVIQTRKRELDNLLRRYSPKHPDVTRLKSEIAALEAELQRQEIGGTTDVQISSTVSPLSQVLQKQIAGLNSEIASLQSQAGGLRNQIAEYQSRVENTPVRGIEISKISRTYDITLRKYQDLLAKGLESELSENVEKRQKGEQFEIIDPANLPLNPIRPNRPMILLGGLLLGLAAGCGVAFLWDNINTSFWRGDEVIAYASLPLLATLPALITRGSVLEQRRAQGLLMLASIGTLALGIVCIRVFGPIYF